eukprot:479316-Prymnesium_polylepis.1
MATAATAVVCALMLPAATAFQLAAPLPLTTTRAARHPAPVALDEARQKLIKDGRCEAGGPGGDDPHPVERVQKVLPERGRCTGDALEEHGGHPAVAQQPAKNQGHVRAAQQAARQGYGQGGAAQEPGRPGVLSREPGEAVGRGDHQGGELGRDAREQQADHQCGRRRRVVWDHRRVRLPHRHGRRDATRAVMSDQCAAAGERRAVAAGSVYVLGRGWLE